MIRTLTLVSLVPERASKQPNMILQQILSRICLGPSPNPRMRGGRPSPIRLR